ncbi:AraC family transcriptional regulator [Ilumatobacter sp.]|uniref:AraC family transcriptional regulator n=1 Tax=Ilumatobacter sp. TaxID=1967498 RepID=UPI003C5B03F1
MSASSATSIAGAMAVIGSAGVDPLAAGDEEALIAYASLIEVLEDASRATDAADFGRRLAMMQGVEILGPVGVAVRTAPNVAGAIMSASRYLSVYSPAVSTALVDTGGERTVGLRFTIQVDRPPDHRQATALTLGVALRIMRLLLGDGWSPVAVDLPHRPLGPVDAYSAYFGSRIRFGAESSSFTILRAELARPVAADAEVHRVVGEYLASVSHRRRASSHLRSGT